MKNIFLTFLCIIALTQVATTQEAASKKEFIGSHAMATVSKQPDTAYVIFYVKTDGNSATEALKKLEDSTELVIDALKKTGKKKIRSIEKNFIKLGETCTFNGTDKIVPSAANQVILTIEPSIESAAELIDVILNNGAALKMISGSYSHDNIENTSVVFGIEKFEEAEKEATEKALAKAKSSAQKMAALIGKKTGDATRADLDYYFTNNNEQNPIKNKTKYISANYEKINVQISLSASFQLLDN